MSRSFTATASTRLAYSRTHGFTMSRGPSRFSVRGADFPSPAASEREGGGAATGAKRWRLAAEPA